MSKLILISFLVVFLAASGVHSLGHGHYHDSSPPEACVYQVAESIPQGLRYNESVESIPTHEAWSRLLSSATRSIKIASFYWTLHGKDVMKHPDPSSAPGEQILDQLLSIGRQGGVEIQIAVNKARNTDPEYNYDIRQLQEVASIRWLNMKKLMKAGVLHTKFILVDDHSFYLGSANMDWRSLTQVKELGVAVFNCPTLATDLNKIFQVYWLLGNSSSVPTSYPEELETAINKYTPAKMILNDVPSLTYFSSSPKPFNPSGRTNDISAILDVISRAEKFVYIAVMDYSPSFFYTSKPKYWPLIDDALKRAAIERKVEVRLLASLWNSTRETEISFLSSLDSLNRFNLHVRMFVVPANESQRAIPFSRVNHNKYMVTDKTAYIGTSNWSADYFLDTCGVGLIVDPLQRSEQTDQTPSLQSSLQHIFERDWNSAYAKPVPRS